MQFDDPMFRPNHGGKMKNRSTRVAPVLGMGLFSLLLAGCGWSSGETAQEEAKEEMATHTAMDRMPEKTSRETVRNEAGKGASTQVVIDNFTFDPPELTISAGTKVTWINHDDVPHTATSTAKPKAFDSGTLDTDQEFSFVFKTPGTYKYYCAVHPRMIAQIVVK
jgi:plastocyanin